MKSRGLPFFASALIFPLLLLSVPSNAHAIIPIPCAIGICIGGPPISSVIPCVNGLWIDGIFMYIYGTKTFPIAPPTHPGQFVLGSAAGFMVCLQPCPIGLCPIGGGFIILPLTGASA